MRDFFKAILVCLLVVVAVNVPAVAAEVMDMGILAGYRMNDADTVSGQSVDGKNGFQVGGLAFLPMNDKLYVRTGFVYAQRTYELKSGGSTSDAEFAHFDIPVTLMYKLGDLGGIFAGPGLGLKISDDCDGNDCPGAKSTLIPVTFGGHFKVAPQFSAEVFYEMTGKVADAVKDARAVGVNAIVTFE